MGRFDLYLTKSKNEFPIVFSNLAQKGSRVFFKARKLLNSRWGPQILNFLYIIIDTPYTLYTSESIWPPPFSTGVYKNEEPSPEGQRDKEIPLS